MNFTCIDDNTHYIETQYRLLVYRHKGVSNQFECIYYQAISPLILRLSDDSICRIEKTSICIYTATYSIKDITYRLSQFQRIWRERRLLLKKAFRMILDRQRYGVEHKC